MANKKDQKVTNSKNSKSTTLYAFVVAILLVVALISGRVSTEQSGQSGGLAASDAPFQVHVMDVGQGDSVLVIVDGHAMLIDGSVSKASSKIISYLESQNITELEYVAATHLHADHIGGLPKVIEAYPPKQVVESICPDKLLPVTNTYEHYLDAVEASGAEYLALSAGDEFQLGGALVTVLAPVSEDADDLNNTSLVLKIEYGDCTCIFTGDMEAEEEETILSGAYDLRADFLKVGHHGSSTSSSEAFLAAVQPDYAAISCGVDNSYGHPHAETLEKLKGYTDNVYVTAEEGDIVFLYDAATNQSQIVTANAE
ncbi:MAG: MBL fold metallo-hydrolase [Oscillospiraceae bacterium]|nr:MBL fold metallo-hydrolase [Oscillospiraceae bacterium]